MTDAPHSMFSWQRISTQLRCGKIAALSVICFLCFTGCKSSYDVTVGGMGRNQKFTGVTKPVFNKSTGKYTFKNSMGQEFSVAPEQIRVVEPHVETVEQKFTKPAPKK